MVETNTRTRLSLRAFALALAIGLFATAQANADTPPTVTQTSFSGVGTTTATLQAFLDPGGAKSFAHFAYVDQATYAASGFAEAHLAPEGDIVIQPTLKGEGTLTKDSFVVSDLSAPPGFAVGQTIKGTGIIPGTTIVSIGANPSTGVPQLRLSAPATQTASAVQLSATGPQSLSAEVTGLTPATAYRFHLVAENKEGPATGPDATFYTLALPPSYGPCPNDAFRSGPYAPFGHPSAPLPDCRSYEQASPTDKDGGDLVGDGKFVRAADQGAAITFGSTFAVPGAEGAQFLPFFQASRGQGEAGWSTNGLLPPASTGQAAQFMVGWLPDLSATFASATRLGTPRNEALFELHRNGAPPTQLTAYTPPATREDVYSYAGASSDGSEIVIETRHRLPPIEGASLLPDSKQGFSNVYVWDKATGEISVAGVMNSKSQTDSTLPKGAFAGPYDWAYSSTRLGGSYRKYYLSSERAVSADGSLFFTAAGTGQLYQRLHPTAEQSKLDSEGNCTEADKACTIHVSATEKTNGKGPDGSDPAGSKPAVFQAASADGKSAFFTSSEKLTNDANTGPEQQPASIGRAQLNGDAPATEEVGNFLPAHALGIAISPDDKYIYWVDPTKNSIGRAELHGDGAPSNPDDEFIVPEPTSYEPDPAKHPGVTAEAPSVPQYVAVDAEHVYWTNRGPLNEINSPINRAGTIGRATLSPTGALLVTDPEFIKGASNPQGIVANADFVFWANSPLEGAGAFWQPSIGRANIDGSNENPAFITDTDLSEWKGLALTSSHIYLARNGRTNPNLTLERYPLAGGARDAVRGFSDVKKSAGIAIDHGHLYWVVQGATYGKSIGRTDLDFNEEERCPTGDLPPSETDTTCADFLGPAGTPFGLATDSEGHLYYSLNGEAPPNPGNDLYRRGPDGHLTDLSPDPGAPNGAEVQGVLGSSSDGSYVYFVANGILDDAGEAEPGDCTGSTARNQIVDARGTCNLYLWHDGAVIFVAPLTVGVVKGNTEYTDALNWTPTPAVEFKTASFSPKTAQLGDGGRSLVFRSARQLTDYENQNTPEFYRYKVGEGIVCVSCNPSGHRPTPVTACTFCNSQPLAPTIGTTSYPGLGLLDGEGASTSVRFASADGNHVFFETYEALVAEDTNGAASCPPYGTGELSVSSCQDVYEWEAPGAGTCTEGGPGYSPLNEGCVYLLSTGKSDYPSFLGDASAEGSDVFIFTRDPLVGQDTDSITDVYDARIDGGLAAQNPISQVPCEAEGCKPGATAPPPYAAPPQFSGPTDPKPKRCKGKKKGCKKAKSKHAKRHKHTNGKGARK